MVEKVTLNIAGQLPNPSQMCWSESALKRAVPLRKTVEIIAEYTNTLWKWEDKYKKENAKKKSKVRMLR